MKYRSFSPELTQGAKLYPNDVAGLFSMNDTENYWFVDGDKSASGSGVSFNDAFKTIQEAVNAASKGDTIFIAARKITALSTDPVSYTENVSIPNSKPQLSLVGISRGRTQGGLPQLKVGTVTSSPVIKVSAPGVMLANLGINGIGGTGGGVQFFDDGGVTAASFGGSVVGCHFKNCVPSSAADSSTGGALWLNGAPWQFLVKGNIFYKNVGGVTLSPTYSDPNDVTIENNIFDGTTATADSYIYLAAGGGGSTGINVIGNYFGTALPNISSGAVKRYVVLANCTGLFADNYVAGSYTTTGFGSAKAAANIATTVGIAHNYSDAGLIVRE